MKVLALLECDTTLKLNENISKGGNSYQKELSPILSGRYFKSKNLLSGKLSILKGKQTEG